VKKIASLILATTLLTGCSQGALPLAESSPSSSSVEANSSEYVPTGLNGQCFDFFQTLEGFKGNTATQYISVQGGSTEQALEVLKDISADAEIVREALWALRASLNLYKPESEMNKQGAKGVLETLKVFEPILTKFVNVETVSVDELTEQLGTIELLTHCAGLPQA
jgi:hypothetical protein